MHEESTTPDLDEIPRREPSPGGRGPKRAAVLSAPVVILLVVAGIAWAIPIAQGFHFGCDVLAGDEIRETRLGLEMCRARTRAEVNEAREKAQEQAQQDQQANERREAEERKSRQELAHRQRETERPSLEAEASKLRSEAAAARKTQQREEAGAKHDEAEAKHEEADAKRVGGEEPLRGDGSKGSEAVQLDLGAASSIAKAGEQEARAAGAKSEAESKEAEATEDERKAAEGRPITAS